LAHYENVRDRDQTRKDQSSLIKISSLNIYKKKKISHEKLNYLMRSPVMPTYKSKLTSSISSVLIKRLTASITILRQIDARKIEFINGPNTSARTQPKVFLVVLRLDI
jgi:hypothetical protein